VVGYNTNRHYFSLSMETNQKPKGLKTHVAIFTLAAITGLYFFVPKPQGPVVQPPVAQQNSEPAVLGEETSQGTNIEKEVFGFSEQRKPIEGYIIGSGDNVLFLHASLHGDEIGTTDLLNLLMEEIKANPDLVASTTKLVVLPIANPDGYYDRTDKLNARGVNLNLNFGTSDWQDHGPEGTYAGPKPFSEIESRIIKKIVEKYNPGAMIAFHSEGALVSPEEGKASVALAKWYAKKTGYKYFEDWDYPGTATKWFEDTTGFPAITVEISKQLQSDWEINKKALLELISEKGNTVF
jgi:predicted deacylase